MGNQPSTEQKNTPDENESHDTELSNLANTDASASANTSESPFTQEPEEKEVSEPTTSTVPREPPKVYLSEKESEIGKILQTLLHYQDCSEFAYSFEAALEEIKKGHKETHWIWYVFPQAFPCRSTMGKQCRILPKYCLDIAEAILDHEVLGPNFVEICNALQSHAGTKTIQEIAGTDDFTIKSCLTLFSRTRGDRPGKKEAALALSSFFTDECETTKSYIHDEYQVPV